MRRLLAVPVALGLLVACEPPRPPDTNDIRSFRAVSLDGRRITYAELAGKVVILDFWATNCPPCREEIPHFVELQKENPEDLIIIGVSLDQATAPNVAPMLRRFGVNYPVVFATRAIMEEYGPIMSIPTTFIADKTGKVRERFVGYRPKSTFEQTITPLLIE